MINYNKDVIGYLGFSAEAAPAVRARIVDFPDEPDRQHCRDEARENRPRNVGDPPIRKGAVKMPSQQCTASNRSGPARMDARGTRDNPIVVNAAVTNDAARELGIHPMSEKLSDPLSYNEILERPDKEQWLAAHKREHEAHLQNGTYVVIPRSQLPSGAHLLTWKDVYKLKKGSDGKPVKYKARFTIRGCAQRPDEYGEVSADVFSHRTLRVMCALVAHYDMDFHQADAVAAFLQGDLKEELYAVLPKGLGISDSQVIKLQKTIYGLKQAGHEWQQKLFGELRNLNYSQCTHVDKCLWIKTLPDGGLLAILVWVDDIPYANTKKHRAQMVADMKALMSVLDIEDMGEAEYILGWRITRDRVNKRLTLDQQGYITHVLEDYGMVDCNPQKTPGTAASILFGDEKESTPSVSDSPAADHVHNHVQLELKHYRSVVGALQYLANCTRPDIANAVNQAAKFCSAPTMIHLQAVKKILKYLSGTKQLKLTYTGVNRGALEHNVPIIDAYSDADWAGDLQDRKSTTGWILKLAGGAVSWCSRRQDTVAKSTMEAEYVAASSIVDEIVWMRRLLETLHFVQELPTVLNMDNKSAIETCAGKGKVDKRKHIDVKHHAIMEKIEQGIVSVKYIPSVENQADIFTKALSQKLFVPLVNLVMGATSA
jgi:hypothetical protein